MANVPTDEKELFVGKPLVAHLATSVNDRPHVTPVSYYYENGALQIITTGKKVENIRTNPRVALSIQTDDAGHPEWMVLIKGTACVVDSKEAIKQGAMNIYKKYFGENIDEWDEFRHEQITNPSDDVVILEIDIGSIVSKRY